MAKAMDRPVRTFSIGFDTEGWYSELPYAAIVARHFGTQHETLTVSALDMKSLLPTVAVALDEPLADPAAVPTFLLSRFAREHVTVALTGEGADELFAGYDRYRLEALRSRTDWIPISVRRGMSAMARPWVGGRARKALEAAAMGPASGFVHLRSVMPHELRRGLLRAEVAAQVPSDHLESRMAAYFDASSGLDAALRADTLEWLPDDLLMKVDKTSMLASLEARVPFLDYRIVERVAGFPVAWKYQNGRSKVLLKAVAEGMLPAEIVHRPKHGFRPPIGHWLQGSLRAYLESTLLDSTALSYRWLEQDAVRAIVRRYWNGEERLAPPVWVLLCLEIWLRNRDGSEVSAS
jgi:asparagine synthase (glutamine-hydrolysing)